MPKPKKNVAPEDLKDTISSPGWQGVPCVGLGAYAKIVYGIVHHTARYHGSCTLSNERIMELAGIATQSTLHRALRQLAEAGFIVSIFMRKPKKWDVRHILTRNRNAEKRIQELMDYDVNVVPTGWLKGGKLKPRDVAVAALRGLRTFLQGGEIPGHVLAPGLMALITPSVERLSILYPEELFFANFEGETICESRDQKNGCLKDNPSPQTPVPGALDKSSEIDPGDGEDLPPPAAGPKLAVLPKLGRSQLETLLREFPEAAAVLGRLCAADTRARALDQAAPAAVRKVIRRLRRGGLTLERLTQLADLIPQATRSELTLAHLVEDELFTETLARHAATAVSSRMMKFGKFCRVNREQLLERYPLSALEYAMKQRLSDASYSPLRELVRDTTGVVDPDIVAHDAATQTCLERLYAPGDVRFDKAMPLLRATASGVLKNAPHYFLHLASSRLREALTAPQPYHVVAQSADVFGLSFRQMFSKLAEVGEAAVVEYNKLHADSAWLKPFDTFGLLDSQSDHSAAALEEFVSICREQVEICRKLEDIAQLSCA